MFVTRLRPLVQSKSADRPLMVLIQPPQHGRPPRGPIHLHLPIGALLFRIFDPTVHGATALSFRTHGPHSRFDHHRGQGPLFDDPRDDPERVVYYAAFTLSGCIVEVFGDRGSIVFGERHVAKPQVTRDLDLLDLRGTGAMRVGSVAALAKTADRRLTQAWARHFYEHAAVFGTIDGIVYANAHNDEAAIVLFERAAQALFCPSQNVLRLDDPDLRTIVEEIAQNNNLPVI